MRRSETIVIFNIRNTLILSRKHANYKNLIYKLTIYYIHIRC